MKRKHTQVDTYIDGQIVCLFVSHSISHSVSESGSHSGSSHCCVLNGERVKITMSDGEGVAP